MCPVTLSFLSRTVHLPLRVNRSPEELAALVQEIKKVV
jgi:hypothetical protein